MASCYLLAENDPLEARFAASAQYCREAAAVVWSQYSKERWTVALQPSEKPCFNTSMTGPMKKVLCRPTIEYQKSILTELLPVKLPYSNKASNRSVQKRRYRSHTHCPGC